MTVINKDNYFTFGLISTFLWAILPIYAIEMKLLNIDYLTLLYSLVVVNMCILSIYTVINFKKIKSKFHMKHFLPFLSLVIIGALSFLIYRAIYYYGIQNLNPIIVNSLNYSWVFFLIIISFVMNKEEKFDLYTKYMFMLGLVGVFFTFGMFSLNENVSLIYLIMLIGAFLTALDVNIIVKIKEKYIDDVLFIYFIYFTFLSILLTIIYLFNDIPLIPEVALEHNNIYWIVGFALLFFIPKYLWINSYANGDKIIISFLGYFIPVISNVAIIILYDYDLSINTAIGFIFILISGILLNKNIKKKITGYFLYKFNFY